MLRGCLQDVVLSQEVIGPPEPGGDVVRHHHVDGVVTPAQEEERHPQHTEQQGDRVESSAGTI